MFKYCQRLNTIYRVSLCCELSYWQSCNSQWLLHTVSRSRNGALVFIYTKLYFEIVLFLPACYFKSEVTVARTQAVCLQTPGTATIQRQHYHLLEFLMFQVTFTPFSRQGYPKPQGTFIRVLGHPLKQLSACGGAPTPTAPSWILPQVDAGFGARCSPGMAGHSVQFKWRGFVGLLLIHSVYWSGKL